MPAQKRPVTDDSEEEPQRRPLRCSPPPSPQLNGNSHHHGTSEDTSENDVAREPKEEDEEEAKEGEVEAEEEGEEDVEKQEDEEEDDENGDGEEDEAEEEDDDDEEEDSDEISSSNDEEKPEFVYVELADIRKEVQCPICLGILRKTRTVMECLHRFCRECIDKSMRMGNNECPACRTHCASRRSLRDDPNYDALIAALYPDIDKYEEEESAFHEEERTRNKQIQASINEVLERQTEALARRRTVGKETPGQFSARPQRRPTRRRSRCEIQGSEENEDENDDKGAKDSSSADERSTEGRRTRKRIIGVRTSQPSTLADPDGGSVANDLESGRENRGVSSGLAWSAEIVAWGRGGARSHTRHGNSSVGNNKNSRSTRLTRLIDYLGSVEDEKPDELDVHLKLISLDQKGSQSLQQPYLCCRPSMSIKHLCEYVAHQTPLQAEEVEIVLVKGRQNPDDVNLSCSSIVTDELQILKDQETLSGLTTNRGRLILAYRRKEIIFIGKQKQNENTTWLS